MTFDEFVEREFASMVALGLALLRDEDDALDVAQEAMVRAFERWDDVSLLDRPGAWCRRVALNIANDRLRARTRSWRLRARLAGRSGVPSTTFIEPWDAAFWAEVGRLPSRQRDVVVLHYVVDLAVAEIAEIVEVAEGTVKSDLSRARERLRQRLEQDRTDGDAT